MEQEERSIRLVRRIEALSDVVMGFSLALLGLTLFIPPRAFFLMLHPAWLASYIVTFALIAFLWTRHQRLLAAYFVPTPLCVAVNFVFLSMLGLMVYFVRVFSRVPGEMDRAIAFIGYASAFGIAVLCVGIMFAIGTRDRWHVLSPEDRLTGFTHGAGGLIVGGALVLGCIATPAIFFEFGWAATYAVVAAFIVGAVVSRIIVQSQKQRIISAANAA